MSRAGEGGRLKKRNCCLTCAIVNFVMTIIFVAALYIGGSILFKQYVSPEIGGLELKDAIALAANVFAGKETEPDYDESDLDSFYSELNEKLFLADKSQEELQYDLVPEAKKRELAGGAIATAAADGDASATAYDEEAAKAAFYELTDEQRWALLPADTKSKITETQFKNLAGESEAAVAARAAVGLKTYRLSLSSLIGGIDFSGEGDSSDTMMSMLDSLDFDFSKPLSKYTDTEELKKLTGATYDAAKAKNDDLMSISLTGKQTGAFINDVLTTLLNSEDGPLASALEESPIPEGTPIADYIKVASVSIMNTPLATRANTAYFYQEDTAFSVAISIRLRDLVKMALETDEMKDQLSSVPPAAINAVPSLVPKYYSVKLTLYPFADEKDGREATIVLNKKDKNSERLSKLLNALLSDNVEEGGKTFLGQLNDSVVEAFASIEDAGIILNFIPTKDAEGNDLKDENGNTYTSMQIMTWDTLLGLAFSESDLTADDVFAVLKCLYISEEWQPNDLTEENIKKATADFKADLKKKYGVDLGDGEFSLDALSSLADSLDLQSVTFASNDEMKVTLPALALVGMIKTMLSPSEETAMAGSGSLLGGADLNICTFRINEEAKEAGKTIYSLELAISVDIADILSSMSEGDSDDMSKLLTKLLPKSKTYLGIKIYISEETTDGKTTHKIGSSIGADYETAIRINDFDYAKTKTLVLGAIAKLASFDLHDVTEEVEKSLNDAFSGLEESEDLPISLSLKAAKSATDLGGIALPSIYEIVSKLAGADSLSVQDAQDVLSLLYKKMADANGDNIPDMKVKTFSEGDLDELMAEINDKFYIKSENALKASQIFGGGFSDIGADSIYFKPDAEDTSGKKSLYTDNRTPAELRVSLTGNEVAALAAESGSIPSSLMEGFDIELLGGEFRTEKTGENHTTYLLLNIWAEQSEKSTDPASAAAGGFDLGGMLPQALKVSLKLGIDGNDENSVSLIFNDDEENSEKIMTLLKSFGIDLENSLQDSVGSIFSTLEENIPIYYSDEGTAYTVSGDDTTECIKIADVFTLLSKKIDNAPAADVLVAQLHGLGAQLTEDGENTGDCSWIEGVNLFSATDDDYISKNMERAYFMNEAPDFTTGDFSGFDTKFSNFNDGFNLSGEGGLFSYTGDIRSLKISDKALGAIVATSQGASLSDAVSGGSVALKSFRINVNDKGELVSIESGVMIAIENAMLPDYFFVTATTTRKMEGGVYVYNTTLRINNLADTEALFSTIEGLGLGEFNKATIEEKLSSAIKGALENLPGDITSYGAFDDADMAEYTTANYGATMTIKKGDAYIAFPSVYEYLIQALIPEVEIGETLVRAVDGKEVTEKELQSMIVSLHKDDAYLEDALIENKAPKTEGYKKMPAYKGADIANDTIAIFSDKTLAYEINSRLGYGDSINGDLSLENGVEQIIILRNSDASAYAEATDWSKKFSGYNAAHNYLIATAKITLPGEYGTGGSISLLPTSLWFTALADLDGEEGAGSKGLLYDMSQRDMAILQFIIERSSGGKTLNVDAIAVQFADTIGKKLNDFLKLSVTVPYYGEIEVEADRTYYNKADDYYYYATTADVVGDIRTYVKDDSFDGIGYVVLSRKAE